MKKIKRVLCLTLALLLLAALPVLTAGAAGVIAEGTAEVNASALNLRSGAGTGSAVLTTIPRGATVVVLQKQSSAWYRVNYNGTSGYVSADYLKNFSSSASLNLSGKVTDSEVRIRDKASTSGTILGTASKGAAVTVSGIENGWYKVSANGHTGFMRSDFITITGSGKASSSASSGGSSASSSASAASSGSSSSGRTGTVTGSYVNFRTGASTASSVIRVLPKGTTVTVLEETSGWYKISHNGTTGYMSSQYVSTASSSSSSSASSGTASVAETSMDGTGTVTGSYVNFRTGPSTSYKVISTLPRNTEIKILAKAGSWYKISYNGSTGYMAADYVKIKEKTDTTAAASSAPSGSDSTAPSSASSGSDSTAASSASSGSDTGAATSSGSDKASDCAAGSVALYSAADLKRRGTFRWNDYRWTWYSEKVLPGNGLKIPGRHVDENGYVCDENGYIVIASHTLSKGTVVATPLGKDGKVYDYCATAGTLDVYVSW